MARTEFGMTARELFTGTPEWEVDVLVDEWNLEQEREAEGIDG